VRFQVHNMLEPPPHPGGFDIVLCRNVLLYLSPRRRRSRSSAGAAMAEDGWLMLGAGENGDRPDDKLGADIKRARPLPPGRRRSGSRNAGTGPRPPSGA
jgi:chemotaxis protein methyltransferase CheR